MVELLLFRLNLSKMLLNISPFTWTKIFKLSSIIREFIYEYTLYDGHNDGMGRRLYMARKKSGVSNPRSIPAGNLIR